MFRISADGRYLEFKPSPDFEPYVPPAEFLGKKIEDVLPPEVAQDCRLYFRRALRTGKTQRFQYELAANGDAATFEARLVPTSKQEVLALVRRLRSSKGHPRAGARRRYGLTERERTVLRLVAAGKSDKEIGRELGISPLTAHKHLANILSKMGAASRTQASVAALREGILD